MGGGIKPLGGTGRVPFPSLLGNLPPWYTQDTRGALAMEQHHQRTVSVPVFPWFVEAFGYRGNARFVAFYWVPAGDEVTYDDGTRSGTGDPWAFLAYRRHRAVQPELSRYNLGSSDCEADDWLIFDTETHAATVAPAAAARSFLRSQHPKLQQPGPPLEVGSLPELDTLVRDALDLDSWEEVEVLPGAVADSMRRQRETVERITRELDRWAGPTGQ